MISDILVLVLIIMYLVELFKSDHE